jgi:hypothetical protein
MITELDNIRILFVMTYENEGIDTTVQAVTDQRHKKN